MFRLQGFGFVAAAMFWLSAGVLVGQDIKSPDAKDGDVKGAEFKAVPKTGPVSAWKEFEFKNAGFRIRMPGEPKAAEQTVETKDGRLLVRHFVFERDSIMYLAAVTTFPGVKLEPEQALRDAQRGMVSSMTDAKLVRESRLTAADCAARQILLELADGVKVNCRFVIFENQVFTLAAGGPGMNPDSDPVRAFFASFKPVKAGPATKK